MSIYSIYTLYSFFAYVWCDYATQIEQMAKGLPNAMTIILFVRVPEQ